MVFRRTKICHSSFAHRVELSSIDFLKRHFNQTVCRKVFTLLVHTVSQIHEVVVAEFFDLVLDELVQIDHFGRLLFPTEWRQIMLHIKSSWSSSIPKTLEYTNKNTYKSVPNMISSYLIGSWKTAFFWYTCRSMEEMRLCEFKNTFCFNTYFSLLHPFSVVALLLWMFEVDSNRYHPNNNTSNVNNKCQ